MRRLFAALATLGLSAGLLTLAPPAEAARVVTGTILGSDGRAVDVFIGFDLKNSSGQTIDKNGCLATRCGLHGYGITLRLNGDVMQDESTSDMIFDIARQIEYVSTYAELWPGDLISTGSPAGNGTHYGRFLRDGDVIDASITGLGAQRNHCVGAP